ncbi:hypothetical protein DXT99_01200 [Pontibacter diazotrophicus]|uniref:Uncharacterized protein n=1 Tax=Pontibacter diazotrophicus TaxID=1400979 RepID=A0A3D8LIH9_9BACT|nr:hypothetical protein [Pontibacter diazotrophicus]RDV17158.1 hypothetical protein DXT99_01200 [Pontibacter diazotrophicus]
MAPKLLRQPLTGADKPGACGKVTAKPQPKPAQWHWTGAGSSETATIGLTEEEEAFYEILSKHPNAVQDFEPKKGLVKKLLAEVKKSTSNDLYKKR